MAFSIGLVQIALGGWRLEAAAPEILVQPQNVAAAYFTQASFNVTAVGTAPLAYQWLFYGQPLPGEISPNLVLPSAYTNHAGPYRVVVSNAFGAVTSQVAVLSVGAPPYIFSVRPQVQGVCPGDTTRFEVDAFSGTPPTYQWRWGETNLPGATNSVLALDLGAMAVGEGDFWISVAMANEFGAAVANPVRLSVLPPMPVIHGQPQSQEALDGAPVSFNVVAEGCSPLTYQWRRQGLALVGATNAALVLVPASTNDAGDYSVVVRTHSGSLTSQVATLVVRQQAPKILSELTTNVVLAGETYELSVELTAAPPPDLRWYLNGAPLPNATINPFRFYVVSTSQAGLYSLVATNALGATTSAVVRLEVRVNPPVFTLEPSTHALDEGASVVFAADTVANPPARYQWQFNERDLTDATNRMLTLSHLTTNQTGFYRVVASNEGGSVTSRAAFLEVVPLGPQSFWRWRWPAPQGNDLYAIVYGADRFVAGGVRGTSVVTTNHGQTWQSHSSGIAGYDRIAYGNGIFVAIVYGQAPRFSSDGLHWTNAQIDQIDLRPIHGLVFAQNRFVAVGMSGRLIISEDGRVWVSTFPNRSLNFTGLAYGNGGYVATIKPDGLNAPETTATSLDGVNWSVSPVSFLASLRSITFGNGRFVVVGDYFTRTEGNYELVPITFSSSAGINWEEALLAPPGQLFDVTYGNGAFIAVGVNNEHGLIFRSQDAVHWTNVSSRAEQHLFAVGWGDGQFLATGNFGELLTSNDGFVWTPHGQRSTRNLRGIVYGLSQYVAVGNEGLIMTSPNGRTWTEQRSGTTNNLRSVEFANGRFVAVGAAPADRALILTSDDSVTWVTRPTPFADLFDVVYANGQFVAAGNLGQIAASTDGEHWEPRVSGTAERLNSVTWGRGLFVAVGRAGTILTSTDGLSWSKRLVSTQNYLKGVAFGLDRFVAAGVNGVLVTSEDGLAWTAHLDSFPADAEDVIYAAGRFLMVGEEGTVASSGDGLTWAEHYSGCANDLRSAVYAQGGFLLVGNNQTILGSRPGPEAFLQASAFSATAGFILTSEAQTDRTYRLQSSTDFRTWTDLRTFTPGAELQEHRVPALPGESQRYFRIVSP